MGTGDTLRPWTFRVEHIPPGTTAEQLKGFFDPEDRPRIAVKSIVPAVRNHASSGERTSTITFQASNSQRRCPRLLDDELSIDSDFFGFTPLNHPEGSIVADIIAVTGLAGHAYGSWAHSDQKMWLRDYLPKDVPNARILIYGYPSQLQGNMSRSIVSDYTNSFTRRLLDMRASARCQDRPIVFIGHSLGCLIIKKALSDVHGSAHAHNSHLPVPLIIFLGAPHKGLQTSALETLVKSKPTEDMIRELKPESPTLTDLNDRFRHVAKNVDILTCYELYPTKTAIQMDDGSWRREGELAMMVQPDSAKLFWPREESIPCHVDHSQIAKLKRGESGIYPSISWAIKSAVLVQTTLGLSQPLVSDHRTSEESITEYNDFESDSSRSFGGVGNATSNKGKESSNVTAAKSPNTVSLEQLCAAISDNNVREVRELLARGCSVHSVIGEDQSLPPSTYLKQGKNPYLLAALLRQETTLELLLEHGADPCQTGLFKMTALHAVIFQKEKSIGPPAESIVALLLQHKNPLEQGDNQGLTPLMYSLRYGDLTSTKMLLDHGANVNARDGSRYTTLHHAVSGGNLDLVELVLRKGVDIDAHTSWNGMTETALHIACRVGSSSSAQIVKLLLDAGADKDKNSGTFGLTPLHLAAGRGNVDTINVLLASGASIEAQCHRRGMAIHYAFHYGNPLAVRTLLDHGARVAEYRFFMDPTGRIYDFASKVSAKNKEDCVLLLKEVLFEQGIIGRTENVRASNCLGPLSNGVGTREPVYASVKRTV